MVLTEGICIDLPSARGRHREMVSRSKSYYELRRRGNFRENCDYGLKVPPCCTVSKLRMRAGTAAFFRTIPLISKDTSILGERRRLGMNLRHCRTKQDSLKELLCIALSLFSPIHSLTHQYMHSLISLFLLLFFFSLLHSFSLHPPSLYLSI